MVKMKKKQILVSKPIRGAFGKTGRWRHSKPVIDYSKCIRCYNCWLYCPDAAITVKKGASPIIDYIYCKGCGICAQECPKKCIFMVVD
ncbi:MAG: 4Fe-4S binding protein [Candidatus Odinarchaeum yellowstonii]|uniref:4Fe-4S binding protein n=1 Tax=Odinarchaeota yellowstonii (strain LCB_4) TaxID=1841599 RepID=A0AAF0D3J5_ODILC|nr:MAG: 4Fe-4S binding protein [Candidatus Odinarchaeum yellowstonii]